MQTPRPTSILPPDIEGGVTVPLDPGSSTIFAPEFGSLPIWGEAGVRDALPGKVPGPIRFVEAFVATGGGSQVNVASGALHFYPKLLVKADPTVTQSGTIAYRLVYRSDRGRAGYGSPGLPPGWLHPFDVRADSKPGVWGPITVYFANGGEQEFTPQLDDQGNPTGLFPRLPDFVVQGVPSRSVVGRWDSLKVVWADSGASWDFIAVPNTQMLVLRQIDDTTLGWDDSRRLLGIYNKTVSNPFFVCRYGANGMLAEVESKRRDFVQFQYGTAPSGRVQLGTISERGNRADKNLPSVRYSFDYSKDKFSLLSRVAYANGPGKWFSVYNAYEDGYLVRRGDDDGTRRVYTRTQGGVQIDLWDKSGKRIYWAIISFDARFRYTGFKDSKGSGETIRYNN